MIDMLKKILLGAGILAIIVVALFGFVLHDTIDDAIKNKEPQLRQYVQLDEAAQNKYILDNTAELLKDVDLDNDGKPETKEQLELLLKANTNPEVQKALVAFGRSFMATGILASDSIADELPADVKAKYQQERSQLKANFEAYADIAHKVEPNLK